MACELCHSTQWAVVLVGLVVAMVSGLSGVAADGESCLPLDADPTVTIGEPAYLCLRFNNNTQAVLTPIVDDFTQLSIENCASRGLWGVLGCRAGGSTAALTSWSHAWRRALSPLLLLL